MIKKGSEEEKNVDKMQKEDRWSVSWKTERYYEWNAAMLRWNLLENRTSNVDDDSYAVVILCITYTIGLMWSYAQFRSNVDQLID